LSLDFRRNIRDEQKFDGLEALVSQMGKDVTEIAQML
jgi:FAD synthase